MSISCGLESCSSCSRVRVGSWACLSSWPCITQNDTHVGPENSQFPHGLRNFFSGRPVWAFRAPPPLSRPSGRRRGLNDYTDLSSRNKGQRVSRKIQEPGYRKKITVYLGWHLRLCFLVVCVSGYGCDDYGSICGDERAGVCGLLGTCVQCYDNDDCGGGEVCDEQGNCVERDDCIDRTQCRVDESCYENMCRRLCSSDARCKEGYHCLNGICQETRCDSDNGCPDGYREVNGTLLCEQDNGCEHGMIQGLCGLAGTCVWCNSSADCNSAETGLSCTPDGMCVEMNDSCVDGTQCRISYGENADCDNLHCIRRCRENYDCEPGEVCSGGRCFRETCGEAGACPIGWNSISGTNLCDFDPCTAQGKIRGLCGLAYSCVDCIDDGDCSGMICSRTGRCEERECGAGIACQGGLNCSGGRCLQGCVDDGECREGEVCSGGACSTVRCTKQGTCNLWGWAPVLDSLECAYNPCRFFGKPGICGAEETCVQCTGDVDCEAPLVCNIWGMCDSYPGCGEHRGCAIGYICGDGQCGQECTTSADCDLGGECREGGYCYNEQCMIDGGCPIGWIPSEKEQYPGYLGCIVQ